MQDKEEMKRIKKKIGVTAEKIGYKKGEVME